MTAAVLLPAFNSTFFIFFIHLVFFVVSILPQSLRKSWLVRPNCRC